MEIVSGDRVVVKNVRPEGTTRAAKLASYWHPKVYEVVEQLQGVPVFVLKEWNANSRKTRVLHRNLLKRVNDLAPVPVPVVPVEVGTAHQNPVTSKRKVPVIDGCTPRNIAPQTRESRKFPGTSKRKVSVTDRGNIPHSSLNVNRPSVSAAPVVDYSDSDSDSSSDAIVVVHKRPPRRVQRPPRQDARTVPPLLLGGSDASDADAIVSDVVESDVSDAEELGSDVTESDASGTEEMVVNQEVRNDASGPAVSNQELVNDDIVWTNSDTEVEKGTTSEESEESVYEDVDSENTNCEAAHSVDLSPRRATRERRAPKKLEYDVLGKPEWKARARVARAKRSVPYKKK